MFSFINPKLAKKALMTKNEKTHLKLYAANQ